MIKPSEIVAFLQNPYFKEGTGRDTIDRYTTDVDFRRMVLAMSATGKRLQKAFGEEWYGQIWWDNSNPLHVIHHWGKHDADYHHIVRVVKEQQPKIIIAIGHIARRACLELNFNQPTFVVNHPSSFGFRNSTIALFSGLVKSYCNDQITEAAIHEQFPQHIL